MTPLLQVHGLVKRFAGLIATDNVSLDIAPGHIHALIGPNGAGKSTLVNQLCGELSSNEGRVILQGEDITDLSASARVQRGLCRTFQISTLLNECTVRENIAMALLAHQGRTYNFWRPLKSKREIWDGADEFLHNSRLAQYRDQLAGNLSSGGRKQLELMMALAGQPRLLLLDEPMAGLGNAESQEMIEVLQSLRGKTAMLLIEHDMEAVFALADRISVLVYGRLILTGSVDEIRHSEAVREAYLGKEEEVC